MERMKYMCLCGVCLFVAVSQYTVCLLNIRIKNIQYFFTYIYNLQNRVHYFFFPIRDFFSPRLVFFLPFLHSLLISAYVINLSLADIEVVGDCFFFSSIQYTIFTK